MSEMNTDEAMSKLDAALHSAQQEGSGEKLAILKLLCGIGLIRSSKLPSDQISDFGTAAVISFRASVRAALLNELIEAHQKSGAPMDVVVAMKTLKTMGDDEKYQVRLANLTAMFDAPKEAAAEGQANG